MGLLHPALLVVQVGQVVQVEAFVATIAQFLFDGDGRLVVPSGGLDLASVEMDIAEVPEQDGFVEAVAHFFADSQRSSKFTRA